MKQFFFPAIVAGFVFAIAAAPVAGQTPPAAGQQAKPGEERVREVVANPALSSEQTAQLANARNAMRRTACTATTRVALSVSGSWYGTAGADVLLSYPDVVTNVGNAWFANAFFLAPCDGIYFFTVSFVKDSYYTTCGGQLGTTDDVMNYLTKIVGTTPTVINPFGAWSGEASGRRGTGVYSVVLQLRQGDAITSWVHSDGQYHRCLASYRFTGFRVAP